MTSALQIYDPRERRLVALADLALTPLGWMRRRSAARPVRRILLLRLERIGDLLMTLEAIRTARAAWSGADIDLAVGGWNEGLARLIPGLRRIERADAPWLTRGDETGGWGAVLAKAWSWRRQRYDLVINFEPDIRSNFVAWLAGAPRRVGYSSGGGAAFLTEAEPYTPEHHVAENATALVGRAAGVAVPSPGHDEPRLALPAAAHAQADAVLADAPRPWIGIHASGGRESKQWHVGRFAEVGRRLATEHAGTIVLTGSTADRPLVDRVRLSLGGVRVIDAAGTLELPALAALLSRLDVLVTGDTGPMHLAAAMGTSVVALFGPSNPARYGPRAPIERVLRVDLPCSPCGQVRLPPERCRGRVPECLDRIQVEEVVSAAAEILHASGHAARHGGAPALPGAGR